MSHNYVNVIGYDAAESDRDEMGVRRLANDERSEHPRKSHPGPEACPQTRSSFFILFTMHW